MRKKVNFYGTEAKKQKTNKKIEKASVAMAMAICQLVANADNLSAIADNEAEEK